MGVLGLARGAGTAVKAEALRETATALEVRGQSKFSTAGSGVIAARQSSAVVSNPNVTALSHVTVTLTGDPIVSSAGDRAVVAWVELRPGVGFVVHVSRPLAFTTPFTYLVVEPV